MTGYVDNRSPLTIKMKARKDTKWTRVYDSVEAGATPLTSVYLAQWWAQDGKTIEVTIKVVD